MPPKRVKTAHKRNEEETSNIASIPCSQSSFLKFPNETVLEILSYFPEIAAKHVNCNSCGQRFLDDPSIASPDYLREDALLVLSQTCRGLRQRLLPLLWKRFNCYNRKVGGAWYKRVSNEMEVRSVVLSNPKNKELATYVQSCHVVLTRCSTKTVLPAFAQALKSMTNLETLEVLHAHSQMTTPLKNAFEGFSYPWIKTVILPSCAHNILRCCPGVISVTCTEEDGSKLVGALAAANSTKVEVLVDVFPSVTMAKRIVKVAPKLRSLTLRGFSIPGYSRSEDAILALKPLKNLSNINFTIEVCCGAPAAIEDIENSVLIKAAKEILKGPPGERKLQVNWAWHPEEIPGDRSSRKWRDAIFNISPA